MVGSIAMAGEFSRVFWGRFGGVGDYCRGGGVPYVRRKIGLLAWKFQSFKISFAFFWIFVCKPRKIFSEQDNFDFRHSTLLIFPLFPPFQSPSLYSSAQNLSGKFPRRCFLSLFDRYSSRFENHDPLIIDSVDWVVGAGEVYLMENQGGKLIAVRFGVACGIFVGDFLVARFLKRKFRLLKLRRRREKDDHV